MLSKLVDRAICLTLDKRLDMAKELQRQCKERLALDVELFVVGDGTSPAQYDRIDVEGKPPIYSNSINYASWWRSSTWNAWLSHRAMLEKVNKEGTKSVLFLEDDAQLTDDFEIVYDQIKDTLETVPQYSHDNWDILQLGSYSGFTRKKNPVLITPGNFSDRVFQVENCGGWHAVAIKRRMFDILLNLPPLGPFDWMCNEYIQPKFLCWAVIPSIIVQRSGYSYVEGGHLEKKRD